MQGLSSSIKSAIADNYTEVVAIVKRDDPGVWNILTAAMDSDGYTMWIYDEDGEAMVDCTHFGTISGAWEELGRCVGAGALA